MQLGTDLHLVPRVTMIGTILVPAHTRVPSWRAQGRLSLLPCVEPAADTLRTFPYVATCVTAQKMLFSKDARVKSPFMIYP